MRNLPSQSTAAIDPGKIDLREVSLVCVDTRRTPLAIHALQRCLRQASFKECLLLSPRVSTALPAGIRHVEIKDIASVAEYSHFMIKQVGEYFSGNHVLIVQWDGFVTDARQWDPRFLEYDYIGAPWKDGSVGNGGFSLRSRRLMDALQATPTPETHPEDYCICERYRAELEARSGIRFAPLEVARKFSWEAPDPGHPTFGLHGFFNFHRALSEAELIAYLDDCDEGILHSVATRRLLKNLYRSGQYLAARKLAAIRMTGPLAMKLDVLKLRGFAAFRGSPRPGKRSLPENSRGPERH